MKQRLRSLDPAWFAMVMATGIVALAAHVEGVPRIPTGLLWLSIAFYGVLCVAYLARLVLFPRAHLADLRSHGRAMGYFTLPAATAVLGVDVFTIAASVGAARSLWFATAALWLVLVYAVPVALVIQPDKPAFEKGLQGTWLVWVVATQGTATLGTDVATTFGAGTHQMLLLTTSVWLVGGMFYLWVIQLIVRRLFFRPLDPDELSPTYWIDMGAVAISALAGAALLQHVAEYPLLAKLAPFVAGVTMLFWAVATWWIPWLVVMGVWRHGIRRQPLTFEVGLWGLVFPLGMYTVATRTTADVLRLPALATIASGFVWIAIVAWAATIADLIVTPLLQKRRHP